MNTLRDLVVMEAGLPFVLVSLKSQICKKRTELAEVSDLVNQSRFALDRLRNLQKDEY